MCKNTPINMKIQQWLRECTWNNAQIDGSSESVLAEFYGSVKRCNANPQSQFHSDVHIPIAFIPFLVDKEPIEFYLKIPKNEAWDAFSSQFETLANIFKRV